MTSIAQVTALVDAHVNRDYARFRAVTLQIAASLASRSEPSASQLRKLIDRPQTAAFIPLPSANGLLSAPPERAALEDMVLAPSVRGFLNRVLLEYEQREVLMVHSLRPARKLLFSGLPGTGKTMAAGALARALDLPLFRVELHAVITSLLGETSSNLAKIFDHIRSMPAVYLFDEFDALAGNRSTANDGSSAGSEMRRVVNTLLQLIEDDRSNSLLVAATNHLQVLDPALFRRFDEIVTFPPLTKTELTLLVDRVLAGFNTEPLDYDAIYAASPALGHSDLCTVLDHACKDHVIEAAPIDTNRIIRGIQQRLRLMTTGSAP